MKFISTLLAAALVLPTPALARQLRSAPVPIPVFSAPGMKVVVPTLAPPGSLLITAPATLPSAILVPDGHAPTQISLPEEAKARTTAKIAAIVKQAAPELKAAHSENSSAEESRSAGASLDRILRGETTSVAVPTGITVGIRGGLHPSGSLNGADETGLVPRPKTGPIVAAASGGLLFATIAGAAALLLSQELSAWPVIAAFSAVAAVITAVLSYEALSGGAISGALVDRRDRAGLGEALERDLPEAFDREIKGRERYREHDAAQLREFAAAWRAGDFEARRSMLDALTPRDELTRERLLAAALLDAAESAKGASLSGEIMELSRRLGARSLRPMAPILNSLLSRRSSFQSLQHPVTLSVLREWADAELKPEETQQLKPRPTQAPFWAKSISVGVLGLLLMLSGVSTYRSAEYYEAQGKNAEISLRVFYGDDRFIFSDAYFDERILKKVLPVLRDWHATGEVAEARLANAIEILRDSPDPKADNILEAAFKRADLLALNPNSERLLMRTLVERENEVLWKSLLEFSARFPESESVARRLIAAIDIAAEIDSTPVFQNLFYFLNSPAQVVRARAARAIVGSLNNPLAEEGFFVRLDAASLKFEKEVQLQLWMAFFTLDRLGRPLIESLDISKSKNILDRAVDAARAADTKRLEAVAKIEPGEESKLPPMMLEHLLGLMSGKLAKSPTEPLKEAVRQQLFRVAQGLVEDSGKAFKILESQYKHAGVMKPDGIRSTYKLNHLSEIAALVPRAGANEMGMHGPSRLNEAQRELLDRVDRVAPTLIALGNAAELRPGGTPADFAADFLNPILHQGYSLFNGHDFINALREAGLAPDNGVIDPDASYQQGYDAAQVHAVRKFLADMLEEGRIATSDGKLRDLVLKERVYLIKALHGTRTAFAKAYPSESAAMAPSLMENMEAFLDAPGPAAREAAEKIAASLTPNRLWLTLYVVGELNGESPAINRLGLEIIASRLAADRDKVAPKVRFQVLERLVEGSRHERGLEGWLFLTRLGALTGEDTVMTGVVSEAISQEATRLIEAGKENDPRFEGGALAAQLTRSEYPYDRTAFKRVHLAALTGLLEGEPKKTAAALEAVAAAHGLPLGGTRADALAEGVAVALNNANAGMPEESFYRKLREAGFAPESKYNPALSSYQTPHVDRDYFQRMDLATLQKSAAFIDGILESGVWYVYEASGHGAYVDYSNTEPLSEIRIRVLIGGLEALEALRMEHFPDAARLSVNTSFSNIAEAPASRWLELFVASSDKSMFLEAIKAVGIARTGDETFQNKVLDFLFAAAVRPKTSGLPTASHWNIVARAAGELALAKGTDLWTILEPRIRQQGRESSFAVQLINTIEKSFDAVLKDALESDTASLDTLVATGVVDVFGEAEGKMTLARLRAARAELSVYGERIDALIAAAERLGVDAGAAEAGPTFDEGVRWTLRQGYMKFGASSFHDSLYRAGLSEKDSPGNLIKGYFAQYPPDRVAAIYTFLDEMEKTGKVYNGGKLRDIKAKERVMVHKIRSALERLERLQSEGRL